MMTFIGWVEYPSMMFAVHSIGGQFVCQKYVGSTKVVGAEVKCDSKRELEEFLNSLSGAPIEAVEVLISSI